MDNSLYHRLGAADGIRRIVDDAIAAHLDNPIVAPRYANVSDMDRVKQMAFEFFCAGAGGPQSYTGKDMLTTHKGMNISEQEYLAVMDDIIGALTKNGIDDGTKNDVVGILYSLKGNIIRV